MCGMFHYSSILKGNIEVLNDRDVMTPIFKAVDILAVQ